MNKKKKIVIPLILIISILLVIALVITYSYYVAHVDIENGTESNLKTKVFGLKYDGVKEIVFDDINPGDKFEKTFTVESTNDEPLFFNIYMENVTNEFTSDLVYRLYMTDEEGNNIKKVIEQKPLPSTNSGKTYIRNNLIIYEKPEKLYYKLEIEYIYKKNEDQSVNLDKSFRATLGIDDTVQNNSIFYLGDYVELVPDATTYTSLKTANGCSDKTIKPSELTLWRIIEIHNDGSFDAVSEYTSSDYVSFGGPTGYANFVGELQVIASQYSKSGYTINTRYMGFDGQTEYITDTHAFDGTYCSNYYCTYPRGTDTPIIRRGTGEEYEGGVKGDTLYVKDYELVGNIYKTYSDDEDTYGRRGVNTYPVIRSASGGSTASYWLSSRAYYYDNGPVFAGFRVSYDWISRTMMIDRINYFRNYCYGLFLRPIITLKSGLEVASGHGAKDDPYVFR